MNLLFVASMEIEFSHLRRPGDDIRTVANGAGPHHAAAAVDDVLRTFRPEAIISMGFCGALDPSLAIADIVVGTTIFGGDRAFPAEPPVTSAPHRSGPVRTTDHIVGTA